MKLSLEVKVGLFFLIGLALLGIMMFKSEDLGSVFRRRQIMVIRPSHAAGMRVGDTVAVSGLKAGEVERIALTPGGIEMTLGIDRDVRLSEDATATIAWRGLLGDRYVDINPGSPEKPRLPPGSVIPIQKTVELGDVILKLDAAATRVQEMLAEHDLGARIAGVFENLQSITDDIRAGKGTAGKLVADEALYDRIAAAAENLSNREGTFGKLMVSDELYQKAMRTVDDLESAASRLEKIVSENDERMNAILRDLETAVPAAREAFATIKTLGEKADKGEGLVAALLSDKEMRDNLQNALSRLGTSLDRIEEMTRSMQEGKGVIGRLTKDETLAADLEAAVRNLRTVSDRLATGDGTLARLTRDPDMYNDVKKLLDDMRETLRRVKEQIPVSTFAGLLMSAF